MSLYGESDGREPYRRVDEALRTIAKTLPSRTPLFFMYGADDVDEDELSLIHISEPTRPY